METRARLLFVLAGLPEPIVNFAVRDETGRTVYRIDLSFPDLKLAIEYDGRHHIVRQQQWRKDLARREELEGDGWRFVVLVAEDIYATPEQTLARLVTAFAERGRRVRIRREEWRRYFPGRPAS
jgi:very-short-patch-repair endonuclease